MDRKKLLIQLVVLMFLIFPIDRIGHRFYWFYSVWWFDMVLHFFAGLWVGLFFIYVFSPKNDTFKLILKTFLGVLLIGFFWEIFEVWVNNYIAQIPFSIFDSTSDLFFGLAGGLSAILYLYKKIMTKDGSAVSL